MASHGYLLPTRASVMASDGPAELTARTAADVVGLAERAEALGFESAWVGDSVLAKPRHEPLSTLAAVAGATGAIRLGTAVYLPALRDPVHVAHQAATLDQVSGGRFHLGIGTGSAGKAGSSVRGEYESLGVPWDRRGDVLDEALELITDLWSGEPVEYDGEFYALDGASIGFEPSRRPPVHVGSSVAPERGVVRAIRERVAAHGDGWFPVAADPEALALGREQIDEAMRAADRDPDDLTVTYYQDVVIADSETAGIERERAFIRQYYPGMDPTDEELGQRGVFGPPERVAEHLAAYEAAGVDRFVTRFPAENQREQLERFAELL